jgi:predicted hydrolase (HD superfamily)
MTHAQHSQDGDQGLPGDDLGDDEEEHPMTGGDLLADEDPEEEDVADLV